MPPRVRLSREEAELLPALLELVSSNAQEFPTAASPSVQASWIRERYARHASGSALTLNLVTLLLFEHGVHRSVDQVRQDLAILTQDLETS